MQRPNLVLLWMVDYRNIYILVGLFIFHLPTDIFNNWIMQEYRVMVIWLMKNEFGKIWKESYTSDFYKLSRNMPPATEKTIKYFSQDIRWLVLNLNLGFLENELGNIPHRTAKFMFCFFFSFVWLENFASKNF